MTVVGVPISTEEYAVEQRRGQQESKVWIAWRVAWQACHRQARRKSLVDDACYDIGGTFYLKTNSEMAGLLNPESFFFFFQRNFSLYTVPRPHDGSFHPVAALLFSNKSVFGWLRRTCMYIMSKTRHD